MTPPVLDVRDITCFYGKLQVLFGTSLTVEPGGRVALLGTNGAGKSTLLKVVCGLVDADDGSVHFKGEDITRLRPEDRVELGISLVAGGRSTFPTLTVGESLRIGAYPIRRDRRTVDGRLERVLDLFPRLRPRLEQPAGTLSGGEQQMVAIGRALLAEPELLLVDELSLGLAPIVMAEVVSAMDRIVKDGTSVVLVEQSLNLAIGLTEHGYFMEKGEIRYSGPIAELADRGDLARSVFFGDRTAAR